MTFHDRKIFIKVLNFGADVGHLGDIELTYMKIKNDLRILVK
jgi:hypothetical protein